MLLQVRGAIGCHLAFWGPPQIQAGNHCGCCKSPNVISADAGHAGRRARGKETKRRKGSPGKKAEGRRQRKQSKANERRQRTGHQGKKAKERKSRKGSKGKNAREGKRRKESKGTKTKERKPKHAPRPPPSMGHWDPHLEAVETIFLADVAQYGCVGEELRKRSSCEKYTQPGVHDLW